MSAASGTAHNGSPKSDPENSWTVSASGCTGSVRSTVVASHSNPGAKICVVTVAVASVGHGVSLVSAVVFDVVGVGLSIPEGNSVGHTDW